MNSVTYEPRTIGLLSEILHPPIELQPGPIQAVHNALFDEPEISYQNFNVGAEGISLSNPGSSPGFVSMANFLPDRVQVREEMSGILVEDFCNRMERVVVLASEMLGIQVLVAQQHVVRMLVNPKCFSDSRDFLAGGVCKLTTEAFLPFDRPVGLFGMKLMFPVVEGSTDFHNLRVESFNQDPKSVFLEDIATFTETTSTEDIDKLGTGMRRTHAFVREKALGFLAGYDRGAV